MSTNKWHFINSFNGYVDFEKELLSIPDEGATSIDIRLTFNTESHTCYYLIALRNDITDPITWALEHELTWDAGIAMLGDEVPLLEELLSCAHD